MKTIQNVKGWIQTLFGNMSEKEILEHLGVDDFSKLQVIESSPTTWRIEKEVSAETYVPLQDETGIDMQEGDADFGIVEKD